MWSRAAAEESELKKDSFQSNKYGEYHSAIEMLFTYE